MKIRFNPRFTIDLQTGKPSLDADIALHFNPRLEDNLTVLNSRRSGVWADEDRQPMCIMQDDGKAMQAFRPGHSTQVFFSRLSHPVSADRKPQH